ncbi:hypothetical protein [Prevotella sp. 10(H)]|uniref:hypothetical protein n=1 Tax=Prevotella sp. 10(H) TaxID=1158294 RepID=UPI0004A6D2DA|nr:hypothetical protein [Prevotella sp. 10(H)]
MKTTIFITCLLLGSATMGFAQNQERKVSKQTIERNKKIDTKNGYNYFLIDMIKDVDIVYTEYEAMVQRVWDKEINLDLHNSAKESLEKIDDIRTSTLKMPVYKGGLEYRAAVLDYIDAVRKKTSRLEKYGILGADANSDITEYNKAGKAFNESDNEAIEKRNIVRRKKADYEKTFYIK